jgi:transglutaminase-like putative cysteine protease
MRGPAVRDACCGAPSKGGRRSILRPSLNEDRTVVTYPEPTTPGLQGTPTQPLQFRVGFEMAYQLAQPTPMILALSIHYSRASDLLRPDHLVTQPAVPTTAYRDLFGNWCTRLVAPAGLFVLSADALVKDSGEPDPVVPWAQQTPVEYLPESTLVYLLGSRYCETDKLSSIAWQPVRQHGPRAGAGCRPSATTCTSTSPSATTTPTQHRRALARRYSEGVGVCRDYAHLAIALCRCMNIPARYCTGYLGDYRRALPPWGTMDFCGLVRGLPGRPLVHLRRAQQHAAHRPRAHGPRARCL